MWAHFPTFSWDAMGGIPVGAPIERTGQMARNMDDGFNYMTSVGYKVGYAEGQEARNKSVKLSDLHPSDNTDDGDEFTNTGDDGYVAGYLYGFKVGQIKRREMNYRRRNRSK